VISSQSISNLSHYFPRWLSPLARDCTPGTYWPFLCWRAVKHQSIIILFGLYSQVLTYASLGRVEQAINLMRTLVDQDLPDHVKSRGDIFEDVVCYMFYLLTYFAHTWRTVYAVVNFVYLLSLVLCLLTEIWKFFCSYTFRNISCMPFIVIIEVSSSLLLKYRAIPK